MEKLGCCGKATHRRRGPVVSGTRHHPPTGTQGSSPTRQDLPGHLTWGEGVQDQGPVTTHLDSGSKPRSPFPTPPAQILKSSPATQIR